MAVLFAMTSVAPGEAAGAAARFHPIAAGANKVPFRFVQIS